MSHDDDEFFFLGVITKKKKKKKVGVVFFFFFQKTIRIVIRSRVKLDNSRGCIIERRVMMMI